MTYNKKIQSEKQPSLNLKRIKRQNDEKKNITSDMKVLLNVSTDGMFVET